MNTGLLVLRLVLRARTHAAGGFFDTLGFRPGKPIDIVASASEAGAGLLLALGLLTPLAAPALAFSRPGKYSLDNTIDLPGFAGNVWGLIAVATSVVSGLAVAHGEWNRRAR